MTASTFMAAVGDIKRFPNPRKLVSYLGLDPKVRQSGSSPARHDRISKQVPPRRGSCSPRPRSWPSAPPARCARYERLRARHDSQIAIVAVARKLAVLFWHLLTREQDYALCASVTDAQKAPRARAARRRPTAPGEPNARDEEQQQPARASRTRARALRARRGRLSPARRRLDRQRTGESGCERDTGARISRALEGPRRATDSVKPQRSALRFASHPHPITTISKERPTVQSTGLPSVLKLHRHATATA